MKVRGQRVDVMSIAAKLRCDITGFIFTYLQLATSISQAYSNQERITIEVFKDSVSHITMLLFKPHVGNLAGKCNCRRWRRRGISTSISAPPSSRECYWIFFAISQNSSLRIDSRHPRSLDVEVRNM